MKPGLYPIEILQIDVAGSSTSLYSKVSPQDKSKAAQLFRDFFKGICLSAGGRMHGEWVGDGGCAFFPSSSDEEIGNSVIAAKEILDKLRYQNIETATAIGRTEFPRRIRLSAHRGEIYISGKGDGVDAAESKHFDHFKKYERRFAPNPDEFFITDGLFKVLPGESQSEFEHFRNIKAGAISTGLYRLKAAPKPRTENIFRLGDKLKSMSQSDWEYLRTQIYAHYVNVAARNRITKGLISHLRGTPRKGARRISGEVLLDLTLEALAGYLKIAFPTRRIRVSYWRPITKSLIAMVAYKYPDGEMTNPSNRKISLKDRSFKVCKCFADAEPVVTPSVVAARLAGNWYDFDAKQKVNGRALMSALQLPIYVETDTGTKEVKGVLSLDSNQSDVFLPQEVSLWRDELVGFMANLALAESL